MTPTAASDVNVTAATDDYAYRMEVSAPLPRIIEALTDDASIRRWWTVMTGSEHHGDEVRLFMGDADPLVFTVAHVPASREVSWAVTACGVLPDWVGTMPSFAMQPHDDGTCEITFRHVGLGPALECFTECRAGWDHFMPSLHQFLETGDGRPNQPRQAPV